MKITITGKEISSMKNDLAPAIEDLVSTITGESLEIDESFDMMSKGEINTKGLIMNTDENTGDFHMEINDDTMCDIIKIMAKLYKRFKPIVGFVKSICEILKDIFSDYATDIENVSEKWFIEKEPTEEEVVEASEEE